MFDWQSIIAMLLVAVSASYLASRGWQVVMRKQAPGCASGCGSCPANNEKPNVGERQPGNGKDKVFVTLDGMKR